jgi:transcriptional regulator with XRE-family HTH domain
MATAESKVTAKDHARLLNNLKLIQKNHSIEELAKLLGVSKNTWTNRMKQPWKTFSYDDFRTISRYCKIEFTQLMEGELKIR